MQKWEHGVVKAESRDDLLRALGKATDEGWELVAVTTLQGTSKEQIGGNVVGHRVDVPWVHWDLFFKRPLE